MFTHAQPFFFLPNSLIKRPNDCYSNTVEMFKGHVECTLFCLLCICFRQRFPEQIKNKNDRLYLFFCCFIQFCYVYILAVFEEWTENKICAKHNNIDIFIISFFFSLQIIMSKRHYYDIWIITYFFCDKSTGNMKVRKYLWCRGKSKLI